MSLEELRKATKQYDAEMIDPPARQPTVKEKTAFSRAIKAAKAARRGRPVVGQGATSVLISIERGLLEEADKHAKAKKMTRSELIALGLRTVMQRRKRSA